MLLDLILGKFYGIDSLIEILIILVSIMLFLYSHKIYKIIKDYHYKFFSYAFLSIALSFIFKILSNITIFHKIRIVHANFIYTEFIKTDAMQIINFVSFILFKCFYLIGFLILFLILTNTKDREKISLYVYFSIIAILFSVYFDFVFHLTIMIILIFLTSHFYNNYAKRKNTNTFLVFIAFLLISLGHLSHTFGELHPAFYLIGESLLLIAFMILLFNQIILNKKSKMNIKFNDEKNKTRGNERFIGSPSKK